MMELQVKNYIQYNLYIGKNDKDLHAQKIDDYNFINIINNIMELYQIDGATITDGVGFYKGEAERSLVLSVIDFDKKLTDKKIVDFADALKIALNQEAILLQKTFFNCL